MNDANNNRSTRVWRMAIILLGVLVLCSCRGPASSTRSASAPTVGSAQTSSLATASSAEPTTPAGECSTEEPALMASQPVVPPSDGVVPTAYAEPQPQAQGPSQGPMPAKGTGPFLLTQKSGQSPSQPCPVASIDGPCIMGMPGAPGGAPLPYNAAGPWIPPGIVPPWPADEYLRDGGEVGPPVAVGKNGELIGLQMEDTVARYKTLDGRILVEPSNKVDLYSPRFNAVRQVVDVEVQQQRRRAAGVAEPLKTATPQSSVPVAMRTQDVQALRGIGTNPAGQLRTRVTHATLFTELSPRSFDYGFRPFENVTAIRSGTYQGSDEPVLARGWNAAIAWQHNEGVQVILDERTAASVAVSQKPQETFSLGSSPNPRLRIVKVASTPVAEPGDEVSFTIRFDNVGNQPIGSVEISDSLTTRLEYVPNSAQCSLKARFTTQPNEGDSLVVRCLLDDPLLAGKGGVFRFRCIVR